MNKTSCLNLKRVYPLPMVELNYVSSSFSLDLSTLMKRDQAGNLLYPMKQILPIPN